MSKFKVGDRVVIVRSAIPSRIGDVATVVGRTGFYPHERSSWFGLLTEGQPMAVLDLPMVNPRALPGDVIAYPDACLELLPDDGHLAGEWTPELIALCKPRKVTA